MERCPTCQARLREQPVCPRCRTDLTWPLALEARAAARLRVAIARLAAGDRTAARRALNESLLCKRGQLARLLRTFLNDCNTS